MQNRIIAKTIGLTFFLLISHIIDNHYISPTNSDQNHFHQVYINDTLRNKFGIKLDHKSELVYNVFGASNLNLIMMTYCYSIGSIEIY